MWACAYHILRLPIFLLEFLKCFTFYSYGQLQLVMHIFQRNGRCEVQQINNYLIEILCAWYPKSSHHSCDSYKAIYYVLKLIIGIIYSYCQLVSYVCAVSELNFHVNSQNSVQFSYIYTHTYVANVYLLISIFSILVQLTITTVLHAHMYLFIA